MIKQVKQILSLILLHLSKRDTMPIVASLAVLGAMELMLFFTSFWVYWLILAIVFAIFSGVVLTNFNTPVPGWWHTLFSPVLLVISSSSLLLFLSTQFTRHLTILAVGFLLALLWENIRRYYWDLRQYHAESLENVSLGINIFIVWFSSSTLFHLLLDPNLINRYSSLIIPFSAAAMLAITYSIDYRTIWVQRYSAQRVWLLLIAQSAIVSEAFWLLNFLPHSIEVKSFLVAITYYLFVSLGRAHLDETLTPKVLRRYVYLVVVFLLSILLTARWLV